MGTSAAMVDRESQVKLDYPNGTINVSQISSESMSDAHAPAFALQHTLLIPAQVSTLTYTQNGMLILGSGELSRSSTGCTAYLPSKDDGSLRLYCPPDTGVVRAIRGLDSEVSSVISVAPNNGGFGHVWVACGSSVSVDAFLSPARRGCI